MTAEIWIPIDGFDGLYWISSFGRVWSNHREGRVLSPGIRQDGHHWVQLCSGGVIRQVSVHELVLTAFKSPRPEGMLGRHDDGNPANNNVGNLFWGTPQENQLDRRRHGTHMFGARNPRAKIDKKIATYIASCGKKTSELIEELGLSQPQVDRIKRGATGWLRKEMQ